MLELTAANTYTGGTALDFATLIVGADTNLGAASSPLSLNRGVLVNRTAFTTARNITLNPVGGTLQTDADLVARG